MNEALITEVARQIVRGELLHNAEFYLILFCFFFLGSAAGAYGGAYLRARGKNLATKADFDGLLAQLEKTTGLTENIKRVVSHEDWRLKEFKTLRRTKLEELLRALHTCVAWLEAQGDVSSIGSQRILRDESISDVEILAALYFPELTEVTDFTVAYRNTQIGQMEFVNKVTHIKMQMDAAAAIAPKAINAARTSHEQTAIMENFKAQSDAYLMAFTVEQEAWTDGYLNYYKPTISALNTLQSRAAVLMKDAIQ